MIYLTPEQKKAFDKVLIESGEMVSLGRLIEGDDAMINKIVRRYKPEVCLNEQYDRGYIQGQGDDIVRFVSCPCSKCTPRF